MMNIQHQKKKTPFNRRKQDNFNNNNNHNNQNNIQNRQPKKVIPTISSIQEYVKGTIYGSLDYPVPSLCIKAEVPHKFRDLPTFPERPAAKLQGVLLASTYDENIKGPDRSRKSNDIIDPAFKLVAFKRQNAKPLKLGGVEIDLLKKNNGLVSNKLVNKFLQNDSLATPPLKRNRDEIVDASSSVKKNKRLQELQQDTTMELSFEGKAMDKNDYVKLVDSSGIMADDSHIPDLNQNDTYDTKNLLQSTEFNFEYKK